MSSGPYGLIFIDGLNVIKKQFLNTYSNIIFVGIGTGMGPVIFADIARVTSTEERTATLSIFSAIRQLGLLVGK